jgi:hypothetical protein
MGTPTRQYGRAISASSRSFLAPFQVCLPIGVGGNLERRRVQASSPFAWTSCLGERVAPVGFTHHRGDGPYCGPSTPGARLATRSPRLMPAQDGRTLRGAMRSTLVWGRTRRHAGVRASRASCHQRTCDGPRVAWQARYDHNRGPGTNRVWMRFRCAGRSLQPTCPGSYPESARRGRLPDRARIRQRLKQTPPIESVARTRRREAPRVRPGKALPIARPRSSASRRETRALGARPRTGPE